jgi:hypothetical protein
MAESALSIDINDLRKQIGMRQGWGRTVSAWNEKATKLADFDEISERALREFYFPAISPDQPYYEWSFLRKDGVIKMLNGTANYDLPDDFGGTILDETIVWNTAATGQPKPIKVTPAQIQTLQVLETNTNNGYPTYFAVRNKAHAPTTGQRWEMMLFPTPDSNAGGGGLQYRYVYVPDNLTNTNKYPAGGAQHGQVILAAHLAAMELLLDGDPAGPERQNFITLLTTAVRNDNQQKQNAGGGMV